MEQTWKEFKKEYRDKEYIVLSEFGPIDFSKDGMKDVVGGKKLTFDQYLNAQRNTNWTKTGLQSAYYQSGECDFMGIITKKNKRKIMFERLYISGYGIEMEIFSETENNVWMDVNGFQEYKIGDAVSFVAVIYRYLFTKYGQQINYGVKNPENIRKIDEKEIPSDRDILIKRLNSLICRACMYNEHCGGFCLIGERKDAILEYMLQSIGEDF